MIDKQCPAANIGYTSGGFQSNLQAPGSLARAVTVDSESATEPARCIPSTLCPRQKPRKIYTLLERFNTKRGIYRTIRL